MNNFFSDFFGNKFSVFKRSIFFLGYKKIEFEKIEIDSLYIDSSQVSFFPLSMNTIKVLTTDSGIFYFRECRKHSLFNELVDEQIVLFAELALKGCSLDNFSQEIPFRTKFSHNEVSEFLDYINQCREKSFFYEKIKKMDYYLKKEHFSPWQRNFKISRLSLKKMGLEFIPDSCMDILIYFFVFIRSSIVSYLFHDFVPIGKFETFSASRSISSYIVAKFLGLERLITPCKMIKLVVDGKEEYGVLCERAPGERALDSFCEISPSLQRELNNLHFLDVICFQFDHFANNYNIVNEGGGNVSVCAYDNDMNKTFFPWVNISFTSMYGGSPYVKEGKINRSHFDINTYKNLLNLDYLKLNEDLSPYLNFFQLLCLKIRLKRLLRAIQKSVSLDSHFLIENNSWTVDTVKEELSGKYGRTYLVQYKEKSVINSSFLNSKQFV